MSFEYNEICRDLPFQSLRVDAPLSLFNTATAFADRLILARSYNNPPVSISNWLQYKVSSIM